MNKAWLIPDYNFSPIRYDITTMKYAISEEAGYNRPIY